MSSYYENLLDLISPAAVPNRDKEDLDIFGPCMRAPSKFPDWTKEAEKIVSQGSFGTASWVGVLPSNLLNGGSLSDLLGLLNWFSSKPPFADALIRLYVRFDEFNEDIYEEEALQIEHYIPQVEIVDGRFRKSNTVGVLRRVSSGSGRISLVIGISV
ncbi:hypothetical protein CSAL01_04045 [Colletotrichum salicis]|uniref:Uncharacterized protein n=1 Tax=Colletotrichum salicis TaxID=1209931 RepID=A0A135V870_9PEZI|nr:hypothetical protein CSAL01_04045 [Colletotrichum salicis]